MLVFNSSSVWLNKVCRPPCVTYDTAFTPYHTCDGVSCLSHQVVRVQYHPGVPKEAGGWLVEPELKMEFIGRMGSDEEESDGGNAVVGQTDTVVAS